ncbi:MAG TPA: hypothetical protein VEH82_01230 [Acidimicrobiales bacterium]|nr:hypothetical protein [Acidimicrobiales bacterium]
MALTEHSAEAAALLVYPQSFADMDRWHERVGRLRRATPVVPVSVEGFAPFLAVLRHDEIMAIERDADLWPNTTRSVLQPDGDLQAMEQFGIPAPRSLVHLDGIEHRDYRQVTNDWFKPAAVGRLQPTVDEVADFFVQRMRDLGGECDFARDIAQQYTLKVLMEIFGVPEEDRQLMLELTQGLFGAADPEFMGDAADPFGSLVNSMTKFITYSGGMEALLRHPEQFRALRDDPDLAVNAADEIIRWTTPVRHFMRYATGPTRVAGVEVRLVTGCSSATRARTATSRSSRSPTGSTSVGPTPTGCCPSATARTSASVPMWRGGRSGRCSPGSARRSSRSRRPDRRAGWRPTSSRA